METISTSLVLGRWRPSEWPEYVAVSHEGMREPGRRYFPERTCRNIQAKTPENNFNEMGFFECSVCGDVTKLDWDWHGDLNDLKFCSQCGAKVAE